MEMVPPLALTAMHGHACSFWRRTPPLSFERKTMRGWVDRDEGQVKSNTV